MDILLRPMTGLELSMEWPGCDWLTNRLHVIRGSRHDNGPCEVKVEGTQHLHDPVPLEESSVTHDSGLVNDVSAVVTPGDQRRTHNSAPDLVSKQPLINGLLESQSPPDDRALSDGDTASVHVRPVKSATVRSFATPTRPRLIASARRPRYTQVEQSRAVSTAASSVPSIGGKFSGTCVGYVG